jgi:hypothetical protein
VEDVYLHCKFEPEDVQGNQLTCYGSIGSTTATLSGVVLSEDSRVGITSMECITSTTTTAVTLPTTITLNPTTISGINISTWVNTQIPPVTSVWYQLTTSTGPSSVSLRIVSNKWVVRLVNSTNILNYTSTSPIQNEILLDYPANTGDISETISGTKLRNYATGELDATVSGVTISSGVGQFKFGNGSLNIGSTGWFVTLPSVDLPSRTTTGFSISTWIRMTNNVSGLSGAFWGFAGTGTSPNTEIVLYPGISSLTTTLVVRVKSDSNITAIYTTTSSIEFGNTDFHHIVVVFNAVGILLYVNNVQRTLSRTGSNKPYASGEYSNNYLGRTQSVAKSNTSAFFMDEFVLYNTQLTAGRIEALYTNNTKYTSNNSWYHTSLNLSSSSSPSGGLLSPPSLYVDSTLVTFDRSDTFTIGTGTSFSGLLLDAVNESSAIGKIDDFRIYRRNLSLDEVVILNNLRNSYFYEYPITVNQIKRFVQLSPLGTTVFTLPDASSSVILPGTICTFFNGSNYDITFKTIPTQGVEYGTNIVTTFTAPLIPGGVATFMVTNNVWTRIDHSVDIAKKQNRLDASFIGVSGGTTVRTSLTITGVSGATISGNTVISNTSGTILSVTNNGVETVGRTVHNPTLVTNSVDTSDVYFGLKFNMPDDLVDANAIQGYGTRTIKIAIFDDAGGVSFNEDCIEGTSSIAGNANATLSPNSFTLGSSGVCISIWIKTTTRGSGLGPGSAWFGFANIDNNILNRQIALYDGANQKWSLQIRTTSTTLTTMTTEDSWELNTWYHVVINLTATKIQLYINNTLTENTVTTGYATGEYNTCRMFKAVNSGSLTFSNQHTCKFDDFRFYDRSLSTEEITQLYNIGTNEYLNTIQLSTNQLQRFINLQPTINVTCVLPDVTDFTILDGTMVSLINQSTYSIKYKTAVSNQGCEFGTNNVSDFTLRSFSGEIATFIKINSLWCLIDKNNTVANESAICDRDYLGLGGGRVFSYVIPWNKFAKRYGVNFSNNDFTINLPKILNIHQGFRFQISTSGSGVTNRTITFNTKAGDTIEYTGNNDNQGRILYSIIIIGSAYWIQRNVYG